MQTEQPFWTFSGALLGFAEVSRELGIDGDAYLREFGFDPEAIANSSGLVSSLRMSEMLEAIARSENCPDFGFKLGMAQQPLQYGMISQIPSLSPTVREALRNFFTYQDLFSQFPAWELVEGDGVGIMRRRGAGGAGVAGYQLVIFSITVTLKAIRRILGSEWHPIGIYLAFAAGGGGAELRRFANAPLFWDSRFNEIALSEHDLDYGIASADPKRLAVLTDHFDRLIANLPGRNDTVGRVRHRIRMYLGNVPVSLESIARDIGMHPRTLQRALDRERVSFRSLLNEARLELGLHLLRSTEIRISEISTMLGYANLSAFSRAFERATGQSPSKLRRPEA